MPSAEGRSASGGLLSRIGGAMLDLVYPQDCIACSRDVPVDPRGLCPDCRAGLPRIGEWRCPRCGDELGPYAAGRPACPSCSNRSGLMFRSAVAACRYEGAAREIVHRLKYGGDLRAVRLMKEAILQRLQSQSWVGEIDLVVPVPLHWTRRFSRRFNQSDLLARGIAVSLGRAYRPALLRRLRRTRAQAFLRGTAREQNMRGAFGVPRPRLAAGRTVLLVDDVMTTCATASECARSLLAAEARRVYVAVFAR